MILLCRFWAQCCGYIVGLDIGISNYGKLIEHGNTEMDCTEKSRLLCLQMYVIVRIEIAYHHQS